MLLKLQNKLPQPAIALILSTGTLALIWRLRGALLSQLAHLGPRSLLLLALVASAVAASSITIHISYHTKTSFSGALLYLIAVWFEPAVAMLAIGLVILCALLIHRRARCLLWVDILTDASRQALAGFAAAAAHDLLLDFPFDLARLGLPAAIFLLGDLFSMPLLIAPMSGARPWHVLRLNAASILQVDGAQYMVAVPLAAIGLYAPSLLPLLAAPFVIIYRVFLRHYHLQDSTRTLLENMADTIDLRDPYTGGHSRRVAENTAKILKQLGIEGHDANLIVTAARIHDIGKIGVPDAILNKPGSLTDAERLVMEQHPVLGADLLQRYPDFARGVAIVRHHHERVDGKGYPDGLRDDEIPFGSKVIAVADTWDALTSDRPYRQGLAPECAAQILYRGRGVQWRAEIVDALLEALDQGALASNLPSALDEPVPA